MKNGESITLANIRLALKNSGWKTTLLTSVFLLLTSVFFALWYYADGFCGCLIRMLPDVRWVGFLPPTPKTWQRHKLICSSVSDEEKQFITLALVPNLTIRDNVIELFWRYQLCFGSIKVPGHFLFGFQIINLLQLSQPKLHYQVLSSQTLCLPGLGSNPWSISYFCFFSHT